MEQPQQTKVTAGNPDGTGPQAQVSITNAGADGNMGGGAGGVTV